MIPAAHLKLLAAQSGFDVLDEVTLPGRMPHYAPVPKNMHPVIRDALTQSYPQGLYAHQAQGLQVVLEGHDLCLATPTASGKSLVFMTASTERLQRDPSVRILALYPAKALIQDQLAKWENALAPLGLTPGYIDGGVPLDARLGLLEKHRVVLMTPDVAHAWLMSHLQQREVHRFLARLRLLILDMTVRYTPQGLMYQLTHQRSDVTWMVKASSVMPIHGVTALLETNLITGETRPVL